MLFNCYLRVVNLFCFIYYPIFIFIFLKGRTIMLMVPIRLVLQYNTWPLFTLTCRSIHTYRGWELILLTRKYSI